MYLFWLQRDRMKINKSNVRNCINTLKLTTCSWMSNVRNQRWNWDYWNKWKRNYKIQLPMDHSSFKRKFSSNKYPYQIKKENISNKQHISTNQVIRKSRINQTKGKK
jgi:hypothetical protein